MFLLNSFHRPIKSQQYPSANTRPEILDEEKLPHRQQNLKGRKTISPISMLGILTEEVIPGSIELRAAWTRVLCPSCESHAHSYRVLG